MDSSFAITSSSSAALNIYSASVSDPTQRADLLVIEASFSSQTTAVSDKVSVDFSDLYKGLSVAGQKIVDKINELIKAKVPDGLQSLRPEDVTPDATAEKIVLGATAFFSTYAKQHPELEGEDLLDAFMKEIRSGIEQGYGEAFDTLDGLGAFQFEGVKEGIQQTKTLIEEKLKAFEQFKREEMGITTEDAA